MSDPESPLARWSRRKSDAHAGEESGTAPRDQIADEKEAGVSGHRAGAVNEVPPAFDPASLPALESIDAKTSLRAFLDRGVPRELAAAALRRGWSMDPAIRDFIGLSENSWDFNAVGGISGFGSLAPEDVERLLAQMLEGAGDAEDEMSPATLSTDKIEPPARALAENTEGLQEVPANDLSAPSGHDDQMRKADLVPYHSADGAQRSSFRHRHGGALPHFEADTIKN